MKIYKSKLCNIKVQKCFRSCFEEAETQNTCIAYRTHQVPEISPAVVSYQMPHKLHLFPKTTSETKTGYSLTPRGVRKDISKKTTAEKNSRSRNYNSMFLFSVFEELGNTKTLHLTTAFFERKATFSTRFLKTLKSYKEETKNFQIFKKLRPFGTVLRKPKPRTLVSHTEHIRCQR